MPARSARSSRWSRTTSRPPSQALKPKRERLGEIAGEIDFLREQIEGADAEITATAERLGLLERDLSGMRKEEELLEQRLAALDETAAAARDRLTALGPLSAEPMPDVPATPQPPIQHRVAVETLRRDRGTLDGRLHSLRAERDVLAAHDPVQLRAEVEAAEQARADAEAAVTRADEAAAAAAEAREPGCRGRARRGRTGGRGQQGLARRVHRARPAA